MTHSVNGYSSQIFSSCAAFHWILNESVQFPPTGYVWIQATRNITYVQFIFNGRLCLLYMDYDAIMSLGV
jgi:hypothetical protein